MSETLNYLFEEKEHSDGNVGVIHVYRKADNAWVGFIRYIKKSTNGKPFVKFYASDLGQNLDEQFMEELKEFSQTLSKRWIENGGSGFKIGNDLDVKIKMVIDKGDGKPPKKVIV